MYNDKYQSKNWRELLMVGRYDIQQQNFSCPDCIFSIPRPDFFFRSNTHAIYFVLFKFLGCTSCEKNLPTLFTCLVNFGNSPTKTPLLVIHPHPVKMKVAIGYTHTF